MAEATTIDLPGMVFHRWERDVTGDRFVCVPPPAWALPPAYRCLGCGLAITDEVLTAVPFDAHGSMDLNVVAAWLSVRVAAVIVGGVWGG